MTAISRVKGVEVFKGVSMFLIFSLQIFRGILCYSNHL